MLITFDTDSLTKQELTAEQYTWLLMIADNKQGLLKQYTQTIKISDDQIFQNLDLFRKKGLIELVSGDFGDVTYTKITPKAKEFLYGNDMFKEFLNEFPQSVTRTDGVVDFLRTDISNAENTYMSYVGRSRDKHEHILKCLKAEIKHRTENGSMPYMKRILSWITNKSWQSYEDSLDSILTTNKDLGYGTTLI